MVEVRRLLDRIRHVTETTDLEISGHTLLNNERAERQEKMENISQEARTLLTYCAIMHQIASSNPMDTEQITPNGLGR